MYIKTWLKPDEISEKNGCSVCFKIMFVCLWMVATFVFVVFSNIRQKRSIYNNNKSDGKKESGKILHKRLPKHFIFIIIISVITNSSYSIFFYFIRSFYIFRTFLIPKKNHRHNLFMPCHIVCGRETKLASYW